MSARPVRPSTPTRQRGAKSAATVLLAAAVTAGALVGPARADDTPVQLPGTEAPTVVTQPRPALSGPARLAFTVGPRVLPVHGVTGVRARLLAPDGTPVAGAVVTVWMTSPKHPRARAAAVRVRTDAAGTAVARLRLSSTVWLSARATYTTRLLPAGTELTAATVAAPHATTVRVRPVSAASKVLAEVASLAGRPYVWGAAGPRAFDCSGLVQYVMAHAAHRHLPHSAAAQYADAHHVSKAAVRPGDLVFFSSGGHVYHVGIYAGHGRILARASPR